MKTTISKMKNTLDGINDRIDIAKENISEIKGMKIETIQNKTDLRDSPGGPVVKTPMLSLQWAQVQSLVGELRSCMPCSRAKKTNKKTQRKIKKKKTEKNKKSINELGLTFSNLKMGN